MVIGAIGGALPIHPEQLEWLRRGIRHWLARWDVELAFTNLEPGAGMMFGEVLASASIPFRVVLPEGFPMKWGDSALEAKFLQLLKKASAVLYLDDLSVGKDAWEGTRTFLVDQCEVVFSIVNGSTEQDPQILAAELKACLEQRAVIAFNLTDRSMTVRCKSGQW